MIARSVNFELAVSALGFFGLPAELQIQSLEGAKEYPGLRFFDCADPACNYFYGVASVFKTYSGELLDSYVDADEADALQDFIHRLNVLMCNATASDCSEGAVRTSDTWEKLRLDARRALSELGEAIPAGIPTFNVALLVALDEFVPREDVRNVLE